MDIIYCKCQVIGNVNQVLPNPLTVSAVTQFSGGNATEMQNFRDRMRSDITAKEIEGSITKTYIKKLGLHFS